MSLNDNVTEDFENTVIDNDLIIAPNIRSVTGNNKTPVTVVAATDKIHEESQPLSSDQLNSLLSMDVKFQTVKDNVSHVTELEDIESDILAQESINQTSVQTANDVFGNILGPVVSLEEFTVLPSKTNYQFVIRRMRDKIALEQAEAISNFQLFIDQPIEDAKEVLSHLTTSYLPRLIDQLRGLYSDTYGQSKTIRENPNKIVHYGGDFINIATKDINDLDFNKVDLTYIDKVKYSTIIENLKHCFDAKILKAFVYGCLDFKDLEFILSTDAKVEYMQKSVSLIDLVDFFANTLAETYLNNLVSLAQTQIEELESLQKDSEQIQDNYTAMTEFIIRHDLKIMNMHKRLMDLTGLVTTLNHLTLNSKEVVSLLVSL